MASQKLLKELLQEDQEQFQLQSYISDRQCQIKRPLSPKTNLQVRKRRPISQNASFPSCFCRNACFLSLLQSPDPRKSPLFEFRSPKRSPNSIFLNIPAKTAAILLEAAVRIQKQSSPEGSQTRTRNAGNAFGLFGSVLKKLTNRKKREIDGGDDGGRVSVKDILRWESPVVRKIVTGNAKRKGVPEEHAGNGVAINQREKSAFETRFFRRSSSSGVWSESNEEKSWDCDFESSSSSGCSQSEGFTEDYDKRFCESPFHFVLQTSPSPCGFQTPNFTSPIASPNRGSQKNEETYQIAEEEEEEEKEQCSPVSVLDPPFQDDDEDVIPSTFRSLQRAKHHLLQKLRRFEKLAGLEIEEQMLSEEQEMEDDDDDDDEETETKTHYELTQRVIQTYFNELKHVPGGIQSLISDIVAEEVRGSGFMLGNKEVVVAERVCERLESWRDVESNTIDMMVEQDFRTQDFVGLWVKKDREVQETGLEIEYSIFGYLVEELLEDMVQD